MRITFVVGAHGSPAQQVSRRGFLFLFHRQPIADPEDDNYHAPKSLRSTAGSSSPSQVPVFMMAVLATLTAGLLVAFVASLLHRAKQPQPGQIVPPTALAADSLAAVTTGGFYRHQQEGHVQSGGSSDDSSSLADYSTTGTLPSYSAIVAGTASYNVASDGVLLAKK